MSVGDDVGKVREGQLGWERSAIDVLNGVSRGYRGMLHVVLYCLQIGLILASFWTIGRYCTQYAFISKCKDRMIEHSLLLIWAASSEEMTQSLHWRGS